MEGQPRTGDILLVSASLEAGSPIGIDISGGRLRIAFMHPDMVRFYGPAWQTPIGAGDAAGDEEVVVLVQGADDRRILLFPVKPEYRESVNGRGSVERELEEEPRFHLDQLSDENIATRVEPEGARRAALRPARRAPTPWSPCEQRCKQVSLEKGNLEWPLGR